MAYDQMSYKASGKVSIPSDNAKSPESPRDVDSRSMVDLKFKAEIDELRKILSSHGFRFGGDIDGLLSDIDVFISKIFDAGRRFERENGSTEGGRF